MNRSLTLFAFASVCALGAAFAPVVTFQPARVVASANNRFSNQQRILRMSEEPKEEEVKTPQASADGSYYDDEVEPIQNAGISNSMRDKLMQEASTGMDSESKQNNVILYIIGIVGVLVVLGGQGILY